MAAWREVPLYAVAERAALALAGPPLARGGCHSKRGTIHQASRDLNLRGRCDYTAGAPAAGPLRPLRDPDGPELDEDHDGNTRQGPTL